jgi:hypothetical protein
MRAVSPVLSALSDKYLHHLEHQLTRLKNLSPFKLLHVNQCDIRFFVLKFAPNIAGGPADRLVPFDELYDIPMWTNGFRPDGHTNFTQRTLVTTEFALDLDEVNVYRRFVGALTPDLPELDRRLHPPASRPRRYLPVTTQSLPLHMQVLALDVERLSQPRSSHTRSQERQSRQSVPPPVLDISSDTDSNQDQPPIPRRVRGRTVTRHFGQPASASSQIVFGAQPPSPVLPTQQQLGFQARDQAESPPRTSAPPVLLLSVVGNTVSYARPQAPQSQ